MDILAIESCCPSMKGMMMIIPILQMDKVGNTASFSKSADHQMH